MPRQQRGPGAAEVAGHARQAAVGVVAEDQAQAAGVRYADEAAGAVVAPDGGVAGTGDGADLAGRRRCIRRWPLIGYRSLEPSGLTASASLLVG